MNNGRVDVEVSLTKGGAVQCVYNVRCLELLQSVRNGQGPGKYLEQQLGVERGWLRVCMHHAVAPTIPSIEQAPSISTPHSWFFLWSCARNLQLFRDLVLHLCIFVSSVAVWLTISILPLIECLTPRLGLNRPYTLGDLQIRHSERVASFGHRGLTPSHTQSGKAKRSTRSTCLAKSEVISRIASVPDEQPSSHLQAPVFVDRPGRQSPRPSFTSSRPSWIGNQHPFRSTTPEIPKMAQKQEIHYSHPGLQPPVFIAGSMCEPEWEPVEMTHREKEDGELDFEHQFRAEPGEYQYKFRLGPGDWWVLDESKPTVDDGTGNRNNLIIVESKSSNISEPTQEKEIAHSTDTQAKHTQDLSRAELEDDDDDIPESEKNLFRHETVQVANGTGESDHEDEHVEVDEDDQDEQIPLLEHEAGPFERVDSQHITPFKSDNYTFEDPSEHAIEVDDDFADDERDAPPLFRHESGVASDEAPLFRHESMSSPIESMSANLLSPTSPTSRKQRKLDLEDVNDPSLEPFPVDEAGIQARIQRVATRRREDEVVFEGTPPSPSLVQTKSFSPQAPPSLPQNEPSDLSHLDAIDETEETDEEDYKPVEKPVEEKDSVVQPVPINIKVQDVSELDSNPAFADVSGVSNHGPPTPPMTPTEHARSKAAPHDGAADSHDVSARVVSPRSRKDNATDHIANRPSPSEIAKPSIEPSTKPSKKSEPENSLASNFCTWFIGLCGGKGRAAGVAVAVSVAAAAFAMNTRSA